MSDQGPAPWGHEGIHDDNDDGDDDVNEGDQDEQYDDDDDDDELNPEDTDDGVLEFEFTLQPVDGDDDDDAGRATIQHRILRLISEATHAPTHPQLLALLRAGNFHQVMYGDGDDDDDEDYNPWSRRRRPRAPPLPLDPDRFPKVPSAEGRKLMDSGLFGAVDTRQRQKRPLALRILDREAGLNGPGKISNDLMAQQMIPTTTPEMVICYDDPVCCGQFSNDGNFYYSCIKDFKVRLYDTSNPHDWRHYKTVAYPGGQWTLTDAALSPDNKWLAFTSLMSIVCLAPTDPKDTGDPYSLNLSPPDDQSQNPFRSRGSSSIFSVRFSGDGRRLVAGTGASSIVVYDIERRESLHHVRGHDDDVNAVSFADKLSPHILYSGSDDCTIKVWDTRSLADGRPAGAFVGHVEGITYIDSKGDGRYILSNGKDQSMKLWDLRMAMSSTTYGELDASKPTRTRRNLYDYRVGPYSERRWFPHPHDNSVVTFRGHTIQQTLIRCHFSPPGSSNSRYVYSGSYDGSVYVWNLDATLKAKIDVKQTAQRLQAGQQRRYRVHPFYDDAGPWVTLVRDVAWHPTAPVLVASSWNGFNGNAGTATVHVFDEFNETESQLAVVDEKLALMEAHRSLSVTA